MNSKYLFVLNKIKIRNSLKFYNVILIILFLWLNLVQNNYYLNSKINDLTINDSNIIEPVNELVQESIILISDAKKYESLSGGNNIHLIFVFNPFKFKIHLQECGFRTNLNIIHFIKIVSFNINLRAPPFCVS